VLLHVTLFNPGRPKPDATKIGFTTIAPFYPPAGQRPAAASTRTSRRSAGSTTCSPATR
jgi:hypothetical protein